VAEEIIGGYRLVNLLMTGQTSQVWEVVEVSSGRHFALKMLLPEHAQRAEQRRLLLHEAEVGKLLTHPNIIRIVHIGRNPHHPYYVMEYFPAGSLKLRILRKQMDWVWERAHSILKQAATALAYMNASGWVHRDVKPDNFLVNHAGELRLIDFALAIRIQKPSLFTWLLRRFRQPQIQGTRSYMSPEQIRGEPLDGRADIYSYGASAYEIVTGRTPFRAGTGRELLLKHLTEKPPSPRVYNPEVTEEFANLVLRMLAKKREDRPRDFHEVLMALRGMRIFKGDKAPQNQPG
jgi:serine/threonine protein kinase